jgi:hypothetical protein
MSKQLDWLAEGEFKQTTELFHRILSGDKA